MKRSDPVPRAPSRLERRAFIAMISGSLLAAPLVAGAQPAGKVYRIGFLRAGQPPETYLEDFQQGLRERGYVYGQNVVVEFRATDGSLDQLPRFAEELVRSKVDVILASAAPAAMAVRRATASVPASCRAMEASNFPVERTRPERRAAHRAC